MKKIHVSAINRKVRDDEKLFVEECDRKYNEKLVAIADSIEEQHNEKPILLLADHQTTGGYAKIATVISADIPKAAQLAAGNTVRFEEIGVAEAQEIARERHAYLAHLAAETV